MDTDYEQQQRNMAVFARKKRNKYIVTVAMFIIVIAALIARTYPGFSIAGVSGDAIGFIAVGIVVLLIIYSSFDWRCPACKNILGRSMNPKRCPSCGVKLQKDG
jgi:rubrerythrin